MHIRPAASALFASAMIALGLAATAMPAQAALSQCARGHACIWNYDNYDSLTDDFQYNRVASRNGNSLMNNGYCGNLSTAYFFDNETYNSRYSLVMYCPGRGLQSQDPYLTNNAHPLGGNWNNRIGSGSFGN